jgi:hypothetical protein
MSEALALHQKAVDDMGRRALKGAAAGGVISAYGY